MAMRVVMLTDDVQIDRRILLESESLAHHGYEVIVIAGWASGHQRHSWQGPVKIERFRHDEPLSIDEGYGFPEDTSDGSFDRAPGSLRHRIRRLVASLRFRARMIARRHRALVISATAVRQWTWRSYVRTVGLYRSVAAWLRRLSPDPVDPYTPAEQALAARVRYFDPDVLHVHDLPQLRVGVNVKRALGIPLIYDAHELYPEIGTLSRRDSSMLRKREQALLPQCDQVITVNPLVAKEMARQYGVREPLVIQNATSSRNGFTASTRHDRFRQQFAIAPADYILLYQGWLAKHRSLQMLVRAGSLLPEHVHLVFMGYGDAQDELRALAAQLQIAHRVHLKDAVAWDDLLFWTASADVGIIPYQAGYDLNTTYCSPNKLYEYIEAGLPMLGNSDLPFVREVIVANGFGVVDALRLPADFARAITTILGEGREGLERYRGNILRRRAAFSWEVEEKKLVEAYHIAMRSRRSC
jgi:glycosyltransferase involved in cell wall biosynthesis